MNAYPASGYLDGTHRLDGARSFAARGVSLREGAAQDPPGMAWVHGLSHCKHELVLRRLAGGGIDAHDGSLRYGGAARSESWCARHRLSVMPWRASPREEQPHPAACPVLTLPARSTRSALALTSS